ASRSTVAAAACLVALLAVGLAFLLGRRFGAGARSASGEDPLVAEAVNDHLRLLYAERPTEVESGGIHRVKPWFTGRLDLAAVIGFAGDDEYPLGGGAVGYFVDRKAAVFVFNRRLHVITLLVFRAEGLPWSPGTTALGAVRGRASRARGFNVLMWQKAD